MQVRRMAVEYRYERLKTGWPGLGSQEDFSDGEFFWIYLMDERIELSKAAFLSMQKKGIHLGVQRLYGAYTKEEYAHQKKHSKFLGPAGRERIGGR